MASKEDDPYFSMVGMMQKEGAEKNPVPFLIGTVTAAEPLQVKVMDAVIGREQMKVNAGLLAGYSRTMRLGTTGATGSTTSGGGGTSHSHGISSIGIPGGSFTTADGLQTGDQVLLLMSKDQQQFVLLCKLI